MSRVLVLSLLVLCACRTVTPAAPPPTAVWEVPLALEANGLPLVEATIGGKKTLLIVDTGSPDITLQAWFVKALEVEPAEDGAYRVAELSLQVGAFNTKRKWRIVETVSSERERGIGGTLSPQRLLESGAMAIDFPNKRLLALDGKAHAWLRWLDERSPKGQVEALPRSAPFGKGLNVKSRVGDGKEVVTCLASGQTQSLYASHLFDNSLLAHGPVVEGLHVRVGDSEFGPVAIQARFVDSGGPEGWLAMDVLRNVVLLVPIHEIHPIWLMTPR